jgi:hypothetical protein
MLFVSHFAAVFSPMPIVESLEAEDSRKEMVGVES